MKTVLLSILPFLLLSASLPAQEDVISSFQIKWKNSKGYLMEIAEAMPEKDYAFSPTPRQMSFADQLLHIRDNMLWLSGDYILEKKVKRSKSDSTNYSKDEILELLVTAFDTVSSRVSKIKPGNFPEMVDFFAGEKSKLQILNLMQDHVSHHRGQIIVYLNLKSIEPPRYVGW